METTVDKLKVGAPLVMGAYGVLNESPSPIVWLKATPNCDFISSHVVDYIPFDAQERGNPDYGFRYAGNPDYGKSNIQQFLNSGEEYWYESTHEYDTPPDTSHVSYYYEYSSHYGFLYHFEEFEIAAINGKVRLPRQSDILGAECFQLFRKKGVRTHAADDVISERLRFEYKATSFVQFLTQDHDPAHVCVIGRSGRPERSFPSDAGGLRPVFTLKKNTVVVEDADGMFRLKYTPSAAPKVCTDEDIMALLGLAQP